MHAAGAFPPLVHARMRDTPSSDSVFSSRWPLRSCEARLGVAWSECAQAAVPACHASCGVACNLRLACTASWEVVRTLRWRRRVNKSGRTAGNKVYKLITSVLRAAGWATRELVSNSQLSPTDPLDLSPVHLAAQKKMRVAGALVSNYECALGPSSLLSNFGRVGCLSQNGGASGPWTAVSP